MVSPFRRSSAVSDKRLEYRQAPVPDNVTTRAFRGCLANAGNQRLATKELSIPTEFITSPLHRLVRRLPFHQTNLFHPVAATFHNKTLGTFFSHEAKPVWNNPRRRARLNVRDLCQGHGEFVTLDVETMRPE